MDMWSKGISKRCLGSPRSGKKCSTMLMIGSNLPHCMLVEIEIFVELEVLHQCLVSGVECGFGVRGLD